MKLIFKKYFNAPISQQALLIKDRAAWIIASYRFSTNEIKLNKYLIEKYSINLKTLCKKLANRATVMNDGDSTNINIFFINKSDDDLANLITYGNSDVRGSFILRDAFKSPIDSIEIKR